MCVCVAELQVSRFADVLPLVNGSKPAWGDTTGSTENAPVLCCDRVDFSPVWKPEMERVTDFPESTSSYTWSYFDPNWIFYIGWCALCLL